MDHAKDLDEIRRVFDSYGVRFFVVYGLALGMFRDGKPLPGDDDIDLAVVDPVDYKVRKSIGWDLVKLGFLTQPIAFNVPNAKGFEMEVVEPGYNGDAETGIIVCERNIKFTIFFFKEEHCVQHGAEYVCIPKFGAVKLIATPKKFYEKSSTLKIGGKRYLAPYPMKDYLSFTYFGNWKDKKDRRHGETYVDMHRKACSNITSETNK